MCGVVWDSSFIPWLLDILVLLRKAIPSPLNCCGWGYSLVIIHLSSMFEALRSISNSGAREEGGWESQVMICFGIIVGNQLTVYFISVTPFHPDVSSCVNTTLYCYNFVVKFWSWETGTFSFDSFSRFFCLFHLSCPPLHMKLTVSLSVFLWKPRFW